MEQQHRVTLPTLEWNASSGATSYRLIIATDAEFSDIVYNDSTITDTSKTLTLHFKLQNLLLESKCKECRRDED
jgi:hypothetical protein